MRTFSVGDWVRRSKRGVPHLVESVVSGDCVTRCGKRLRDEPNDDGPLVLDTHRRPCRVCVPEAG